ncbi:MAG TPA: DegT/DnrJ/EryC1/StrS family aminotransferase [Acidimicrobiia bacterium]|nr:DegT/DnrJ/EryC1/StrS family aminotransferase [Acidimicrobiia bacterium]
MMAIPVSQASVGELEEKYALDALDSGWLSGNGPYVERFENEWSRLCATKYAVAVASGTAALHLLLLALAVRPGDEVIVPALTFVAVANAIRHAGGVPVVVDVDAATWCLSPDAVAAAITARTVGVVAVHAYGHPADMDTINVLARRAGLWVVEDGAEAHLARYRGRPVGGLGVGAAFSFFGNKIVTTGEGGAVTTDDADLAHAVRALSRQGVGSGDDRYAPSVVGLGLKLGNLAAAVGCAQLERADDLLARRRAAAARYVEGLFGVPNISFQPVAPSVVAAPWLFSILVDAPNRESARDDLARTLSCHGIETRNLFPPLGSLAAARPARHDTPVARDLATRGLSLPLFAGIEEHQIDRVVETIARTR